MIVYNRTYIESAKKKFEKQPYKKSDTIGKKVNGVITLSIFILFMCL